MVKRAQSKRGDAVRRQRRLLLLEQLEDRRLLAVDWRNPVDSLDVNRDGEISPIDALLLINDINKNQSRALTGKPTNLDPYLDPSGDSQLSPIDILFVINQLNLRGAGSRTLREGNALDAEDVITITVGETDSSTRTYRLEVTPKFDTSDKQSSSRDLFAIYLVDPQQPDQTLLDRGTPGTTLFTLSETGAEFVPGRVRWDGQIVEIDLSQVTMRDTAKLKLQLLSTDSDHGSQVTVRPLSNVVDEESVVESISLNSASSFVAAGPSLNLTSMSVANDVEVLVENVRLDPITLRYKADLRLHNNGASLGRDVAVIFKGILHVPGELVVDVESASGQISTTERYVNFRNAIPRGGLQHGMNSDPVTVSFFTPYHAPFSIRPEIRADVNHPPTLNAIGPLTVSPGSVLRVPLQATDADGDAITYSLKSPNISSLPNATLLANGTLVFRPAPSQLGTYQFDVIASDGALEAVRSVTLKVVADPITSTRVSGRVLQVNGSPLGGMRVEIGAVQGLTNSDGSFTLNLGNGPLISDTIKVRGELFGGPITYPFIAEKLPLVLEHDVYSNVNNVIERPIYLPALDVAGGTTINPMNDVMVQQQIAPGEIAEVFVASGTLMNQQGTPFTGKLSITEVPSNLTPAALPAGFSVDLVVTIQPGEMVFTAPAPLSLPNRSGYAPGERLELWSINPVTGQFDSVGTGQVSFDGTMIETISGGIRNSSWHFFAVPEVSPQEDNPRNQDPGCKECKKAKGLTSEVELHSGELIEIHNLVTYQADGATRGLTLNYDSLRADPRPIISFGTDDVPEVFRVLIGQPIPTPDEKARYVASITIDQGSYKYQVPGYTGIIPGLYGGEHFWTYSSTSQVEAALQADLRSFPSGIFPYAVEAGFVRGDAAGFIGTRKATRSELISVNSINSPFGAGWGLAGLLSIVVNSNGSVLVIDGDGSEVRYAAGPNSTYVGSPGEFAKLERINGLFRQTTTDKTVYQFNADNQIATITDRNGNVTTYQYTGTRLDKIVDSVGLETTFTYTGNRVTKITDPAGRITTLAYDTYGNLTSITDPDNSRRTWDYDGDHHMIGEIDQLGRRETTEYGFHGRAIGAVTKDQKHLMLEPLQTQGLLPASQTSDPLNSPPVKVLTGVAAKYMDENGRITETPLDSRGQELAVRDAYGLMPSVSRENDSNLPVTLTDGRGNLALMAYDAQGNLIKRLDSLSSGGGGQTIGEISYIGEEDHYSFTGHAGQRLLIDGIKADSNAAITIFDSAGISIGFTDSYYSMSSSNDRIIVLPYDDMYSVSVKFEHNFFDPSPPGPPTGNYRFRLIDVDEAPTLPLATPLIGTANESQLFKVNAQPGQRLKLVDQSGSAAGGVLPVVLGPQGERLEIRFDRPFELYSSEFLITTPGTYFVLLHPLENDKVTRYQFQATLTDPAVVAKTGLDIDHTGNFSTGVHEFTFSAPAGTPIQFYWVDKGAHAVSIIDPLSYFPLLEAGAGLGRGSPLFVVPHSGSYTVSVGRSYPGYVGELDDFAFRLMDLSAVPVVQIGSTITGTMDKWGRQVAYRFQGQAGQRIDFGAPKPGTNAELRLGSSSVFNAQGNGISAHGVVTLPQSAEYTVIVQQGAGAALPTDFAFTLTPLPATLTSIALDTPVSGQLTAGSGRRYFQIAVNDGDVLYFDDLGSSDKIHVHTQLANGSGQLLQDDLTLAGNEGRIEYLRGGKYMIILDAGEMDRPASYSFEFHSAKTITTALTLGQTVQSSFTQPIQTNVHTFSGTAGQQLFFDRLDSANGFGGNLSGKLFGPSGDLNQNTLPNTILDQPIVLPRTGQYRLELQNRTSDAGSVSFRLIDPSAAPLVTIGTSQSGTLDPAAAVDRYRLHVVAGQRITFAMTAGGSEVQARLFYPNGEPLNLSTSNGPATFAVTQGGDYTIAINGFGDTPVSYAFLVTDIADTPVTPANLDHSYSGTGDGSEITVGTFTGNAGTLLFVDGQNGYGSLNLYDSNNNLVQLRPGILAAATTSLSDGFLVLPKSDAYTAKVVAFGDFAVRLRAAAAVPLLNLEQNEFVPQSPLNVTDLYRLNVAAGQVYQLDQTSGAPGEVTYRIYTPAGATFSQFGNNLLSGTPATADIAGTYFMAVSREYTPGGYGFQVRDVNAAPLLAFDQPESGMANPLGQRIIRRFEGVAGQRILLSSTTGTLWEFYDPQFTPSGSVYTEGAVTLSTTGIYTIERVDYDLSAPAKFSVTLSVVDDSVQPIVPAYLAAADTSVTYDPNFNQPTNVTNELGHQTLFDIDPITGNTRSVTRVVGAVGGTDNQVTTMTYLPSGLIDTMTDPLGRVTDYDYDARRRLITVTSAKGTPSQTVVHYEYASLTGNVSAYVDENGHRTTFEYDPLNRLKKVTEPDPDGTGPLASPSTQFTYDAVGNRLTMTDANGRVTSMTYDAMDRMTSTTDPGNNTTKYAYDSVGNLVRVTDPLNHATVYRYDQRDRVTASVDPEGKITTYQYDESDTLISLTDASNNTTKFEYDARDRLTKRIDPLGHATKYAYDALDRLLTETDRLGRVTEFAYDDLDRLVKEIWRNPDRSIANTVTYAYDKADNLVQAQDNFSSVQFVYDALDRATQAQTSGPGGIPSAILAYSYDAAGNMLSVVDTINGVAGGTNTYNYDALDRVTRIVQNGTGVATKRVDMQYNPLGQMTSLTRFSDAAAASPVAASTYAYDALNRISSITHRNAANNVLDSFAYQYDPASRITRITDIDGVTDYTYDTRDQLTGANHADPANLDETYVYDATGNRVSSHKHGGSYLVGDGPGGAADNNRLASDGTYDYTYDDEGNLIKRVNIASGAVREFAYDHRNRLIRIADKPSAGAATTQVVKYVYDVMDRRIAKNVDSTPADSQDGVVTTFVYDGSDVLVEFRDPDGSGPAPAAKSMRYLHGPAIDQVLAQEDAAGNVQWHLADHLGTIHDLVNNAGQTVNHLTYDSYGNVISESNPSTTTRYRVTGREFDAETGLMYYRARYYDATTGRFISEDPIGLEGGVNVYMYVGNHPLLTTDPSGLDWEGDEAHREWDRNRNNPPSPKPPHNPLEGLQPRPNGTEGLPPGTRRPYPQPGRGRLLGEASIADRVNRAIINLPNLPSWSNDVAWGAINLGVGIGACALTPAGAPAAGSLGVSAARAAVLYARRFAAFAALNAKRAAAATAGAFAVSAPAYASPANQTAKKNR